MYIYIKCSDSFAYHDVGASACTAVLPEPLRSAAVFGSFNFMQDVHRGIGSIVGSRPRPTRRLVTAQVVCFEPCLHLASLVSAVMRCTHRSVDVGYIQGFSYQKTDGLDLRLVCCNDSLAWIWRAKPVKAVHIQPNTQPQDKIRHDEVRTGLK